MPQSRKKRSSTHHSKPTPERKEKKQKKKTTPSTTEFKARHSSAKIVEKNDPTNMDRKPVQHSTNDAETVGNGAISHLSADCSTVRSKTTQKKEENPHIIDHQNTITWAEINM